MLRFIAVHYFDNLLVCFVFLVGLLASLLACLLAFVRERTHERTRVCERLLVRLLRFARSRSLAFLRFCVFLFYVCAVVLLLVVPLSSGLVTESHGR